MPLTRYACTHCGHWHQGFVGQWPNECLVCSDVRNALPPDGWDFAEALQVACTVQNHTHVPLPGITAIGCTPVFGLGATGWIIAHEHGNIAFEAAPFYQAEALDQIALLGGIHTVAASHPHGYGALWQLQERFDPNVVIHRNDVCYTKAFRVTWPADDVQALASGITLHHVGGHYDGQCVLYDADRKAAFVGDALKIDFDVDGRPAAISCHKGYHYAIPLSHGELRHYRAVFSALDFDHVFTTFEYGPGVTTDHALALFDTLLSGPPTTRAISLGLLS